MRAFVVLRLTINSVVIADEAHRLKQPATGITLAMKKFVRPICFALTGTLIQNRMEEMWSILDFVSSRDCVCSPLNPGSARRSWYAEAMEGVRSQPDKEGASI